MNPMRGKRFDHLLSSAAVALALAFAAAAQSALAQSTQESARDIEAAMPVPDTALPPPLTLKDIEPAPARVPAAAVPAAPAPSEVVTSSVPAPAAASAAAADSTIADKLRELSA